EEKSERSSGEKRKGKGREGERRIRVGGRGAGPLLYTCNATLTRLGHTLWLVDKKCWNVPPCLLSEPEQLSPDFQVLLLRTAASCWSITISLYCTRLRYLYRIY